MNWFITFSLNEYEVQYDYAASLSAGFFTLFTIGRFLGGFLMKKFTKEKVILTFLICAFVLYTIGLLTNQSGLMLISVSGFFFSVVMTIIFLLINDCFPNSYVKTLSVILIFADLIEIVANLFLGILFETIGYKLTFFIIPVALITCFLCLYTVVKNKDIKKKNDLLKGC